MSLVLSVFGSSQAAQCSGVKLYRNVTHELSLYKEGISMEQSRVTRLHFYAGIVAVIGYLLSPFSRWNDLFVNLPLAYLFALPFSLFHEQLYLPAFVLGYWLSNLLGLMLLHHAGSKLIREQQGSVLWKNSLVITLLYTFLIIILVGLGVLPSVNELLGHIK